MSIRLRVTCCLAVLVMALSGGSPAGSQETPRATLEATGASSVGLGEPFRYKASIENDSSEAMSVEVTFRLIHEASGNAVDAARWRTQALPGSTVTYQGSLPTGQWFADTGRFRVEAVGAQADPVAFVVEGSSVRVPVFEDVTGATGVSDSHVGSLHCGRWAAGAAWGDVDGDHDLDLYLPRRPGEEEDASAGARLWINDDGHFADEAQQRGVAVRDGIGAVFADFDNDGDQDLYAHSEGPDHLFVNDGRGFFSDRTESAGVDVPGASQSATWVDFNYDGWLDLYVTNHRPCSEGGPDSQADTLLRNNRDGSFTEVTDILPAEEGSTEGAGFQMGWFDYDNDGDHDFYLVNDYWGPRPQPNILWRNAGKRDGNWTFKDVSDATDAGIVMNSMGLGIGDYDRDLDFDLAISDIRAPALMRNTDGRFNDESVAAGIARDDQDAETVAITWGLAFNDLNNDGWEDLYIAAGRLSSETYQPNALFTNATNGRFLDHSAPSRTDYAGTSRGVAFADYDRDGRMDMYVVNQDASPILYRNVTPRSGSHWLEVDTVGRRSSKDGCGARMVAHVGRVRLLRQVFCGGTSLATGSDTVVHFGLGGKARIDKLVVEWPSGRRQVLRDLRVDRSMRIVEPRG